MPGKDDNIVKFQPKPKGPEDEKVKAKKELMERIVAGANNLRNRALNQHFIYYISLLIGFMVVLAVYFTMIIGLVNAN